MSTSLPSEAFARMFAVRATFVAEGTCPPCRGRLDRVGAWACCGRCGIAYQLGAATDDERWMGDTVLREHNLAVGPPP